MERLEVDVGRIEAGEGGDQEDSWLEEPGQEGGRCNILGLGADLNDLCANFYDL